MDKLGAWASIIGLVAPALAYLVPGWGPSLPFFSALAGASFLGLAALLGAALRRINKKRDRDLRSTTILVLAARGSIGAEKVEEIAKPIHDNFNYANLGLEFHIIDASEKPVDPSHRPAVDTLRDKLQKADAVVIMTDIRDQHPDAYRVLMAWCYRHRERPVIFYAPAGVVPKDFDFPVLSGDRPEGVLDFLTHSLLAQAINRGELLKGWFRLVSVAAVGLVVSLGAALVILIALYREAGLYRRSLETPAVMQNEVVSALAQLRDQGAASPGDPEAARRARIKALTSIAKLQIEQINRTSNRSASDVRRLIFFAGAGKDGKACLCEVANSSNSGGCLAAGPESIVGCAFSERLAVVWRGASDKTDRIRAWRLDGTEVGKFDPEERVLKLPNRTSCGYQTKREDDPKRALLCMPLGISDQSENLRPEGAVCLSLNEDESFVEEPWLRWLLLRSGYAVSGMSFEGLLDPTLKANCGSLRQDGSPP